MLRSLVKRGGQPIVQRCLTTRSGEQTPLRVLFCGSDDFSIASLQALHRYSKTEQSDILSIDVAAKSDKPSGRGLKTLKSPLIKRVAKDLGLPFHQFSTFTGWQPPTYSSVEAPYINLIVAVSFGLLIPRRILQQARFGGLNVHPSLLPQLRGAAPINWTIINGDTHTGISVQTLHPTKFDEGVILAQTPKIQIPDDISVDELRGKLAPLGGELLVGAIRNRLYLNPTSLVSERQSSLAPKISTRMKEIQWEADNLQTVLRKNRGMPKLWANASQPTKLAPLRSMEWVKSESKLDKRHPNFQSIRILFGIGLRAEKTGDIPPELRTDILQKVEQGRPIAIVRTGQDLRKSESPLLLAIKNDFLVIPRLQVAGDTEKPAVSAAARADLIKEIYSMHGYTIYMFHEPLQSQG